MYEMRAGGDLTMSVVASPTSTIFPLLRHIKGDLDMNSDEDDYTTEIILFPSLLTIGSISILELPSVATISFPSLVSVTNNIEIQVSFTWTSSINAAY
jgi:hypothetical protein